MKFFDIEGGQISPRVVHGKLEVRSDTLSGVLHVLPRVANEVWVGIGDWR